MSDSPTNSTSLDDEPAWSRRVFLHGAAVGAATVPLLVACGSDDESSPAGNGDDSDSNAQDESEANDGADNGGNNGNDDGDAEDPADDGEGGSDGQESADAIANVSEIEVGGGVIIEDADVVITQPDEGSFVGLSARCTHRGCLLSDVSVSDGLINCASDCGHGSQFDLEGGVVTGPATEPLPEVEVRVDGDSIVLA